ncbi:MULTISPECIES: hypothetical protein [unclassified Flavobacterium]|uniref:hypothetical protein n=1 Tax=unclassified Flavobacterium TaxID=196869 RepID=UPI0012A93F60|nr:MULTISPECIES: hypothetical protein [unclassified Flavobacterium]MBF4487448.1 hypothetical protein [Flavobacterium sp. CSZ]QGK75507.1 hypothetical protein GIY83_15920 [Flavobacterium sp. SLB02]
MEPNNFEKDFREKLNQRKIEPSHKAWDRLDAMLSIAEEKKQPKNKKRWMYIAAGIVGFLLVGTLFFNQKKSVVEMPKDTVVIKENLQKDSVVKPALKVINPVKAAVAVSEKTANQNSVKEEKSLNVQPNKILKTKSNQIAESSIIIKNNQEKQSVNNQSLAVETSKKETVDQLLQSAEKTIVAENSVKPKSKVKINANDLLHQVDGELELSFREKMITKVNKNYQTVKVALANRNQQE